ncbi:amino acid permease [Histoplasma capsulatum var. duboisii H88]|uniref:Amino acid permease n=1 Tax=Ajellomyces capsulatus (strain H88) TaxID=544711 RepID=F0U4Q2_AJEC8|nr:amino acid permease [Histoplasma capsulatum var. duboisii H88]QSS51574.1 amino acid permease [Histoplasma capsulatum var. duboisii H88]
MAEMVTYLPISSPFIRFAGRYVDEAFGVATGYNFFVFEAAMVPFEIVACNVIIHYWSDIVPAAGIITIVLVLYGAINFFAVKWYGESEFWLALGKALLIIGLIIFTFVTMLGGNPLGDRYGFRHWRDPGAFAEFYKTGDLGRFLGFLQCMILASFTIAGPDYVSMAAGETENPRYVLPRAFNAVFYRLTAFFVLGSLCVGIVVPYNDKTMSDAFKKGLPGAAASPYVVAMDRLQIKVLPHIVNAMVLGAAFSAGNSYVYCASRSLFGLALEGKAPRIFTKCNSNGVPIYCVSLVLLIALLSFLQVSNEASVVLDWFVSLVTASQLLNFFAVAFTYTRFMKALDAQGVSRDSLPYKGFFQPYLAYYACAGTLIMAFVGGYTVFLPGNWSIPTFLFSYTMIGLCPVLFFGWKLSKKTKWFKPHEVDLFKDVAEIDEYTKNFVPTPPRNRIDKYFNKLFE